MHSSLIMASITMFKYRKVHKVKGFKITALMIFKKKKQNWAQWRKHFIFLNLTLPEQTQRNLLETMVRKRVMSQTSVRLLNLDMSTDSSEPGDSKDQGPWSHSFHSTISTEMIAFALTAYWYPVSCYTCVFLLNVNIWDQQWQEEQCSKSPWGLLFCISYAATSNFFTG